ncbi:adrenocortical dysplasia protein homolog [Hippoglossus stenolepis]|uniref:adrenocortical dysplasia protein homolog n=1 Tax=Hippoglossus stenolepis TaxID=195615 RepID=UPI001FAEED99|nr:adrenocortical dysplasia protein homolog [Hippoglossus stenolepis]
MPRAPRNQLTPWIESLILGYGSGEAGGGGRLKAHVIGVGQMSQSQALSSEGLTGLLFLSDGVLQLPAVLTASAWEHLQEQEDRECITSLVNATVCLRDYRLQLYVSLQQVRCRFFLSVGELATTAAGPVRDNTPCCTSLPSVRQKIIQAWRALQGTELQESQRSQGGFDLSELLGEWQHDCVQTVLDDVRERLVGASSPQPSTSTPLPTHPAPCSATGWDVDRVKYKGAKRFIVPVECLLLPEEEALRLQAPPEVSRRQSELSAASEDMRSDSPHPPGTTQPPSDEAESLVSTPAVVETNTNEVSPSPVDQEDETVHVIDSHITLLSNPWDIYSPPSSVASLDATPTTAPHTPTAAESKPDHAAMLTSTQLPALSLETTEHSKGEHSDIPPYQQPPCSTSLPETAGAPSSSSPVSPAEPLSRPADKSPPTDERCNNTAQQNPLAEDRDGEIWVKDGEEAEDGKYGKRQRCEEEQREEAQVSGDPPSWLFDTQAGLWAEGGGGHTKGQSAGSAWRKAPRVHSSGRTFSYSYQVSGQNLQDFSGLPVSESLLHWAVKYLVPKTREPAPRVRDL